MSESECNVTIWNEAPAGEGASSWRMENSEKFPSTNRRQYKAPVLKIFKGRRGASIENAIRRQCEMYGSVKERSGISLLH